MADNTNLAESRYRATRRGLNIAELALLSVSALGLVLVIGTNNVAAQAADHETESNDLTVAAGPETESSALAELEQADRSHRMVARLIGGTSMYPGFAVGYMSGAFDAELGVGYFPLALSSHIRVRATVATPRRYGPTHFWFGVAAAYRLLSYDESQGGPMHGPEFTFIFEGRWFSNPTFTLELALGVTRYVGGWTADESLIYPAAIVSVGLQF